MKYILTIVMLLSTNQLLASQPIYYYYYNNEIKCYKIDCSPISINEIKNLNK